MTTPEELHNLLEMAAKACGKCLHPADQLYKSYGNWGCDTTCLICKGDPADSRWQPHLPGLDSAEMCAELDIGTIPNTALGFVDCYTGDHDARESYADHPSKAHAQAMAALRVAAAIGAAPDCKT